MCRERQKPPQPPPRYAHYVAYLILRTAANTKGGVLALFTSYSLMNEVAQAITPKLEEEGYALFKQGDGPPRLSLIQYFQEEPPTPCSLAQTVFGKELTCPAAPLKRWSSLACPYGTRSPPRYRGEAEGDRSGRGNSFFSTTASPPGHSTP